MYHLLQLKANRSRELCRINCTHKDDESPNEHLYTRGLMTGLIVLFLLATAYGQQPATAIVGEWLSAKKDSWIAIYQQGTTYVGKIIWGWARPRPMKRISNQRFGSGR
ncbi:DUF2147 domain-containing protein [Spirosoma flavum]|uniref:Uncharacterized protein n=1 Tax=Spirosoma flavum TaxID=2048557 RepID=A0ABW6AQ08_9BACT